MAARFTRQSLQTATGVLVLLVEVLTAKDTSGLVGRIF